ncbi:MAG: transporter substrate-binding domain-containing protein [Blautia sp.]|nr:transporter substrate-binding domain-containing protein [Blautia sp.]
MPDQNKSNVAKAVSQYGIICFIFLFLCFIFPINLHAEEQNIQKIRVGYFHLDGYHMVDSDGRRSGYGYEFLQKIGRYLPYTYEYIGYDKSWDEMLQMLEKGEIDILTSGGKTSEREKRFEYSQNSIGTTVTMLTVKEGNTHFVSRDYSTYNGAKLGFLKNSYRNWIFKSYSEENQFTYTPVYYDSYTQMQQDLQSGVIDGIVSSNLRKLKNEWVVEQFGNNGFYVMAPKGHKEILNEIDDAIEKLDKDNPGWRTALMNKSYMDSGSENAALTIEEQEYLAQLKKDKTVLKVLVNPDRSPYSYFENGEADGIIPAIFARAAELLDLPYEIIETMDRQEYYELIKSGTADICIDAGFNYSEAEDFGYKLTDAYMSTGFSRITRADHNGEIKTVASIGKTFLLRDYMRSHFAEENIQYYNSIEECINAVTDQKADAAFLYTYTIQEIMNKDIRGQLSFTIISSGYASFAMGVRNDIDNRLLSSLNRVLQQIKNTEAEGIILEKTEHLQADPTLSVFLYKNPFYALILLLSIQLFIIIVIIAVTMSRNQKRLQAAYQQVQTANNAKQDFLSKMSHDIRTPMNAIIGMTALAEHHADDEAAVRQYLEKMHVSEKYLLSLLNEVLDMSKIESGTIELKKQPFSISSMTDEIALIARELTVLKEQEFSVNVESLSHPNVLGDAARIEQILLNLLSNSTKYTGRKGRISLTVTEKDTGLFCFRVEDNGMGIPEEFQEHIYDAFSRAEDSRVSRVQGTGLGLTIVKKLTEMMHGTISVDSHPGKGTAFSVCLPLEIVSDSPQDSPDDDKSNEEQSFPGLYVLLVEDNELNREIAAELLKIMDISADYAENGKEAVDMFMASETGKYDVIFMDLQMPVMNGLEACRKIRKSGRADAGLPIFALTANAYKEDMQNSRDAGMDGHISKPVDISKLYSVLKEVSDCKKKQ